MTMHRQVGNFSVVEFELGGATTRLEVEGELDLATAPDLKWALADALDHGARTFVVDLTGVTFIDSTALGVLVGFRRNLKVGMRMGVACTDPDVLAIFELTGLDSVFEMFSTPDEALAALRRPPSPAG